MFGRGKSPDAEDPSVAPAEAILDRVATRATVGPGIARLVAERALWICACMSMDDAPTWLIFDQPGDSVRWCRLSDGSDPCDLVTVRFMAGGHAKPESVLAWLSGKAADPWAGGDGVGDEDVVRGLAKLIHGA